MDTALRGFYPAPKGRAPFEIQSPYRASSSNLGLCNFMQPVLIINDLRNNCTMLHPDCM